MSLLLDYLHVALYGYGKSNRAYIQRLERDYNDLYYMHENAIIIIIIIASLQNKLYERTYYIRTCAPSIGPFQTNHFPKFS